MSAARPISRLMLATLAATAMLAGAASAEHESGWQEISKLDLIVDIYRTGVDIKAVYQFISDRRILYQEVTF